MTSSSEPSVPHSAWDAEDTLTFLPLPQQRPALLPEKPALPTGVTVTHSSRFSVPASGDAALSARTVARSVLKLLLGASENAERTTRRVETCLAELVAVAYTRTSGSYLVCELGSDSEHVFVTVEHQEALPTRADETTIGLNLVKTIADDYGTHIVSGDYHTWAAVRRV
ncbi:hypothetical protein EF903_05380 [Streptomyces sp. WAC05292]|uniref:hypothetical protein n=1 Tax=Streptomyces sp. WAC05292 TaxID=2487418 RepID=UPI000F749C5A|nr:hypothetical protein [Streptomyces sp. WAC05292]RSS95072.1 hypothetical protein EF903_05380 [Streptomyces sp. WAC05292]